MNSKTLTFKSFISQLCIRLARFEEIKKILARNKITAICFQARVERVGLTRARVSGLFVFCGSGSSDGISGHVVITITITTQGASGGTHSSVCDGTASTKSHTLHYCGADS